MKHLEGKVAWITGASSGIGEALAYELSGKGARLVLSARRMEQLARVRASCRGRPEDAALVQMDVTNVEAIPAKVAEAYAAFGGIDILINNAGISQRSKAVETSPEVVRTIMMTNFFGVVGITTEVVRRMQERGSGGEIVVVSSVVGKIGTPWRSTYSASKHALHGYFDSLRAEIASEGIGVLLVVPGFIRTEVSIHALEADGAEHAVLDPGQEKGTSADDAARKIVHAIRAGKEEVLVGLDARLMSGVLLGRFFPRLLSKVIQRANVT